MRLLKFARFIIKCVKEVYRIALYMLSFPFCLLSSINNNQIIVTNMKGSGYEGWAANICNNLLKFSKLKIVFATKKTRAPFPKGIKIVRYNSLKYYSAFYTSKIVITNMRSSNPSFKKNQQFFIQTWHSGYQGGKKIEADAEHVLSKVYVKKAKADGRNSDLMISCSKRQTALFHKSFWYKGPVLECGSLDYVNLFDREKHSNIKKEVYKTLQISENKKIALFAPTFRRHYTNETYDIDFERLINALNKRFNDDFVILFHYHFNNPISSYAKVKYDNIKFFDANSINIQKLEIAADVGIGDYSGFNTEMCLLGKPVFRYANDLEDYISDRDFYIPFKDQPFPYAFNNDELVDSILNFNSDKYVKESKEFLNYLGIIESKDSIDVVVKFIFDVVNLKDKDKVYDKYKDLLVWPKSA